MGGKKRTGCTPPEEERGRREREREEEKREGERGATVCDSVTLQASFHDQF